MEFIYDITSGGCVLTLEDLYKVRGEIFNLGTDIIATTGDGMKIIGTIMGKNAKIKLLPRRLEDQFETLADITKIRKVLRCGLKVKLEDGLKAQVNWYKEKTYKNL